MLRIIIGIVLEALGLGGYVTTWVLLMNNNAQFAALTGSHTEIQGGEVIEVAGKYTETTALEIMGAKVPVAIVLTSLAIIFGLMLWIGFIMLTDKEFSRKSTNMWILTGIVIFSFVTIIVCLCGGGVITTLRLNPGILVVFSIMMLITLITPFVTLAIAD
ncbi:MAG: hypothetical protein K5694_01825 [Bacilli bacterium]|nr:hypothetical protein [Bacilli bacterium]